MALSSDRELEEQLLAAGNKLLNPPSSDDEFLLLLDQVEHCLLKVDQSPTTSMQNALSPSLKALVADKLLHHPNADVKVAVASCISEITRITAPEAPYEDHEMKEVFQLIVSSFENLSDKSSRSYAKRTTILETVSKVRSCVVMLDLECDTLIVEMFKHFLKAIRDYHPDNVFSSMETIMTLVLEESEDISKELLSPLLASVKKDEEVLPIARKLGERVLESCAAKVKPYLIQAVKSLGISINDYSLVVASICEQETSGAVEQNDGHATPDQGEENRLKSTSSEDATQVDKDIATGETPPEHADPAIEKSPKSVVSNDITHTGDKSFPDSNSRNQEDAHHADQLKSTNSMNNTELDNMETEKAGGKVDRTTKKTPPSSPKAKDPSGGSCTEDEKEAKEPLDTHKSNINDDANSPCTEEPSIEAVVSSVHEKDKALESESKNVASPVPSEILPEEGSSRKAGRPKNDENSSTEDTKPLESEFGNDASPLPSESLPEEGRVQKAGRPKKEIPSSKDTKLLESESENVVSPSPSKILPEEGRKAGRPKKEIPSIEDTTPLESESGNAALPSPRENLPEEGRARKPGRPKKETPLTKDSTLVSGSGNAGSPSPSESLREESCIPKAGRPKKETSSPKDTMPLESESGNVASPSPSESLPEEGRARKAGGPKKETSLTKDAKPLGSESGNAASPSPSESLPKEGRARKAGRPKKETPLTKDTKPLDSESGNAASPSPSVSLPEEGCARKAGRPKKKTPSTKDTIPLESESENVASPLPSESLPEGRPRKAGRPKKKETSSIKETMSSADAISKQASELTSDSEVKPSKYSGEKPSSGISNEDTNAAVVASKKESAAASDSKVNVSKETGKKVETSVDDRDGSSKHSEDKKKRGRPKAVVEKNMSKSSAKEDNKETVSSPKSGSKSAKIEYKAEGTPQTNSKRKHTPVMEKKSCDKSGEDLVGSKIKVWWPKDRMFYEGVVDYYDSAKKKHKVLYIDGDEETLNLKNQKWQLVTCDSEADKGEEAEESSLDAPSDVPQKKKPKTILDLSAKQGKLDMASKRGGGTSSSKAKGSGTKSGRKSMDADDADGKTKSELLKKSDDDSASKGGSKSVTPSKAANKTKDDDTGASKSKDDGITTPKTKQETPKTGKGKQVNKSKAKSPKGGGGRSSANGTNKVKSSSSKVTESEDVEEASSAESAEAPESKKRKMTESPRAQTKTGKKRRRGAKS